MARHRSIRSISRHTPSGAAFGWQSWIVSFGDAAERVVQLRALVGLIVAYTGLSLLRKRAWAPAVLALGCVVAIVCGVIGLWALLRPGGGATRAYRWTLCYWPSAQRGRSVCS